MNIERSGEPEYFSKNALETAKALQVEQKEPEMPNIGEGPRKNIEEQYPNFRDQILAAIKESCSKNEYHNQDHTIEVEGRFEKFAKEANLPDVEILLGKIRAIFHDYGHVGRTIRQEVDPANDVSNEEFAAMEASRILKEWLQDKGLEKGEDDKITEYVGFGILGTSFGQTSGKHARPYKPVGNTDKLLALADIGGFTKGFDGWMEESLNVFRETPFENLPKDAGDMIEKRKGFLKYITAKFNEIKPLINEDAITEYEKQLKDIESALNSPGVAKKYQKEFDGIRTEAQREKLETKN